MNQLATTGIKRVDSKGHRNFNTAFTVNERTKDLIVCGRNGRAQAVGC